MSYFRPAFFFSPSSPSPLQRQRPFRFPPLKNQLHLMENKKPASRSKTTRHSRHNSKSRGERFKSFWAETGATHTDQAGYIYGAIVWKFECLGGEWGEGFFFHAGKFNSVQTSCKQKKHFSREGQYAATMHGWILRIDIYFSPGKRRRCLTLLKFIKKKKT